MGIFIFTDRQHGPLTVDQIKSAPESGRFKETDLAWTESLPNWVPLIAPAARLEECDTEGILHLCEAIRKTNRLESGQLIAQLYKLDWDGCTSEAVEAVELLTYDLLVNEG